MRVIVNTSPLIALNHFGRYLQARIVATGMGLRITGTLGVLLAAKRQNIISDLEQAIKDLKTAGFHIARELTDAFLKINGEKK